MEDIVYFNRYHVGKSSFFVSVPSIPMFLTPAITPWKSTIPGLGANNPSLRLFQYCRDTGHIRDYQQYYLNLTQANLMGKAVWELEYAPTNDFNIPDVSAKALDSLIADFEKDIGEKFHRYFVYNSVSQDLSSACDAVCKRKHTCAMRYIDYKQYQQCVEANTSVTHYHYEDYDVSVKSVNDGVVGTMEIAISMVFLIIVCVFVLLATTIIMYIRQSDRKLRDHLLPRHAKQYTRAKHYMSVEM